jgi:hypothetical protein
VSIASVFGDDAVRLPRASIASGKSLPRKLRNLSFFPSLNVISEAATFLQVEESDQDDEETCQFRLALYNKELQAISKQ